MIGDLTVFFRRSLRIGARRWRTYLIRTGVLVILLFCLWGIQSTAMFMGAPGLRLFRTITYVNAGLIALAGPAYFASLIAEEKEQNTLGLLKMAGLNPISILLGKSTSRLITAVLLLVAQVPLIMLTVTLGGVSLHQVFAGYVALLAWLVFIANLSLLWSVVSSSTARAGRWIVVSLLVLFILPPMGSALLRWFASEGWLPAGTAVHRYLSAFFSYGTRMTVFSRIGTVMQTGFDEPVLGFQPLSNVAAGGLLFLLAWAAFGRFTREQKAVAPSRGLAFRRTALLRRFGVGRTWSNPIAWKEFHFTAGGKGMLLLKFALCSLPLVIAALVCWGQNDPFDAEFAGGMLMGFMVAFMALELVLFANRAFSYERQWQTLAGLVTLPKSLFAIEMSKLLGYGLSLLPAACWFMVGVILAPGAFIEAVEGLFTEGVILFILCQFVFFLHLVALFSVLLKRGGFLVAFVIWYFGGTFAMGILGMIGFMTMGVGATLAVYSVAVLVLSGVLHYLTLLRVKSLAGAE